MALTKELVQFALGAQLEFTPVDATATSRIIVDTLACTIAAFDTRPGALVARLKVEQGGRPDATLAVTGERLPVASVAFVHSQLSNLLDADETLMNRWHLAAGIVGPALATAECSGATGRELIEAVAIGYEVAARLGRSMLQTRTAPDGTVTSSPIAGYDWVTFGATAAVGRLMGLSPVQLANAFGIAYVTTPVNFDLVHHNNKYFRAGEALDWHKNAMYGSFGEAAVNACLLAAGGFRADMRVFDGEFWRSFGALDFDRELVARQLGQHWHITESVRKRFPSVAYGAPILAAFRHLVHFHELIGDDVDEVRIKIPDFPHLARTLQAPWPDDLLKIAQCLPYALWMLMSRVPPGSLWWDDRLMEDADGRGREFAGRIRLEIDSRVRYLPEQLLLGVKTPSVQVTMSGTRGRWSYPDSYPAADTLDLANEERDREKVESFAGAALGPAGAARLMAAANGLGAAPNVRNLTDALVAK